MKLQIALFRRVTATGILRFMFALSMIFSSLAIGARVSAAEIDRTALQRHLTEMYKATDGHVKKWTIPMRFRIFGELEPAQREELHRALMNMQSIIQHDIAEDRQLVNNDTNAIFIFVSDIDPLLNDPGIVKMFKKSEESLADFRERMRRDFISSGLLSGFGFTGESITAVAEIANLPKFRSIFSRTANFMTFTAVTATTRSNEFKPSIVNTATSADDSLLSSFDRAFLESLYSSKIEFNMRVEEALPAFVQGVSEKLK